MFLKGRKDGFRFILPKEFICPKIEEKYTKILKSKNSFYTTPIDFINESIQKIQVLGFENATVMQSQPTRADQPTIDMQRIKQNEFMNTSSELVYRSEATPISLIDKTLNVTFRHELGYLNYFLLFENFFYLYSRDESYKELTQNFYVDIINEKGSIYSRIELQSPMIHSMDMLDLDYTQPVAASETFQVVFKYSNFDFQFIENDE